jgi:hypothetical protein
MREHLVEGFRVTVAPHEVALTAKKAQFLLVDAPAMVQYWMAKEYGSAVEKEKIPDQALDEVLHLNSRKELSNSTYSNKITITTTNR